MAGIDRDRTNKRGRVVPVLLIEALPGDAIGIAGHEERPSLEVWQQPGGDPDQVLQVVSFGERPGAARAGPEGFLQVGDRQLVSADGQRQLWLLHSQLIEQVPDIAPHPTFRVRRAGRPVGARARAGGLGFAFLAASTLRLRASARSNTFVSRAAGAFTTCLPSSFASISSASASR